MSDLEWEWVNVGKEARAGRWTMRDDGIWALHHDDFIPCAGIAPYWTDATTGVDDRRIAAVVRPVIDSFLTWAKSQPPTLEHREGEYVHYRIISEFYAEFVDGQWVFPIDTVRGFALDGLTPASMANLVRVEQATVISHGFLASGTVTTVQPPEPTTYGFVGTVTDGEGQVWDVTRASTVARFAYAWVRRSDGDDGDGSWQDVLALGVFTPVEEEAKS